MEQSRSTLWNDQKEKAYRSRIAHFLSLFRSSMFNNFKLIIVESKCLRRRCLTRISSHEKMMIKLKKKKIEKGKKIT